MCRRCGRNSASENGFPNTAVLLFGKNPQQYFLEAQVSAHVQVRIYDNNMEALENFRRISRSNQCSRSTRRNRWSSLTNVSSTSDPVAAMSIPGQDIRFPVIDFHVHEFHLDPHPVRRPDLDKVVEGMQALRIVKSVAFPLRSEHNASTLDLARLFPGFIIPFAFFHLGVDSAAPADKIEKFFQQGFKGIKFIFPSAPYSDRSFWPVYEAIQKLRLPALFHTAIQPDTKPELLDAVARSFPEMKIIGSHFGNPWYAEAACVSLWNPNVHFDLSTNQLIYFERGTNKGRCKPQIRMLYETRDLDSRKLLFGTDVFYGRREYKTFRNEPCDTVDFVRSVIKDYLLAFDDMGMPNEERERIFYHNAAGILGLE